MRLFLALSLASFLSGCGSKSGNDGGAACTPNGHGFVTTEQRWVSTDDANTGTKQYQQSNLSDYRNFYGYRYFQLKDGRTSSGRFDGDTQPKDNNALTVDWNNRRIFSSNISGREEANELRENTVFRDMNLNLGYKVSIFDIAINNSTIELIKKQVAGKSGNGLTICSLEDLNLYVATSEDNPKDLVFITRMKLNIFARPQ